MLSVLVIDDQKSLLEVIRPLLERFGNMNVKTAVSAQEALDLLTSNTYDAMVVDYDLPDINGIEFLKMIRAKGNTTPLIIYTGVGREYAAIEALNYGADFFLKKGDDVQDQLLDMVHMIRQAVDRRNMGRGPGTTQKILSDAFNFFNQPAFVIDREGTSDCMEQGNGSHDRNQRGGHAWQGRLGIFDSFFWAQITDAQ